VKNGIYRLAAAATYLTKNIAFRNLFAQVTLSVTTSARLCYAIDAFVTLVVEGI